jgi:hypothetical protein
MIHTYKEKESSCPCPLSVKEKSKNREQTEYRVNEDPQELLLCRIPFLTTQCDTWPRL